MRSWTNKLPSNKNPCAAEPIIQDDQSVVEEQKTNALIYMWTYNT